MKIRHALVGIGAAAAITVAAVMTAAPTRAPGQTCVYQRGGALPDAVCTPGATDPAVTQENINQTICVSGYTAQVRPSTSFTNPLKASQMKAYGVGGQDPGKYEEDHLIPLELGGSPDNPRNLFPEPYAGPWGARVKDQVEDELHRRVCAHTVSLALAQQEIATNWVAAHDKYIK